MTILSFVRRIRLRPALAVVAVVVAGCGASDSSPAAFDVVSSAQDLQWSSQPALAGEPVLTFSGVGIDDRFPHGLALDADAIERLQVIEVEIDDPWEKRTVAYRGVLMRDLVSAIDPTGATGLRFTALDDYVVTMSVDDVVAGDVLLATSADGVRLDVADGGPTRIVFLPGSATGENPDLWIWSIATIVAT